MGLSLFAARLISGLIITVVLGFVDIVHGFVVKLRVPVLNDEPEDFARKRDHTSEDVVRRRRCAIHFTERAKDKHSNPWLTVVCRVAPGAIDGVE